MQHTVSTVILKRLSDDTCPHCLIFFFFLQITAKSRHISLVNELISYFLIYSSFLNLDGII